MIAVSFSRIFHLLLRPVLALLLSAPVIIFLLSVQTEPTVTATRALDPDEISQLEQLILDSAPQNPTNPSLQQIQLDANELNLLLRYSVDVMNLSPRWAARLSLDENAMTTELSVNLATGPIPLFLNIRGELNTREGLLSLDSITVGNIQIPDPLLRFAMARLRNNLQSNNSAYQDFSELLSTVEQVKISTGGMDVAMYWDPSLVSRIGNRAQQLFISEQDQQRIIRHYQEITNIAATIPANIRAVSLNTFLTPLFGAALGRSQAGDDPIAENRTLFQTLAIYVNDENIEQLLGVELAQALPEANVIEVRLHRRQDLARHLVSTASVTASAGPDLAAMLSTTKEAYDARYRSGVSFSDLAASHVGVALASLSTRDRATAILLQQRLSSVQDEADYMPEIGNNQDGLSESEFNEIYSNRSSQEYQQRLLEIQALIDNRPVFAGLTTPR